MPFGKSDDAEQSSDEGEVPCIEQPHSKIEALHFKSRLFISVVSRLAAQPMHLKAVEE
jgi:hypothetical protein